MFEALRRDARQALRPHRGSGSLTGLAIVTLALGIGANVAVLSLARQLLERPVPGVASRDVFHLSAVRGTGTIDRTFSFDDFRFLHAAATTGDVIAHYSTAPLIEGSAESGREIQGAVVSDGFFRELGVRAERGRFFSADEEAARGAAPVAVISHAFWQSHYGGAPTVIGAPLRLNGVPFTVIGVVAPPFHGVLQTTHDDVWIPLSMLGTGYRWCDPFQPDCDTLSLLVHLRQGTPAARARTEMAALSLRLAERRAVARDSVRLVLSPLGGLRPGDGRQGWTDSIRLLLAAAAALLLVVCANVGGTAASAAWRRRGEFAIRMSLGATAGRVRRQVLTEGLLPAALGGALGLMVSEGALRLMNAMFATDAEGYAVALDLHVDAWSVTWATLLALGAAMAFGMIPALRASESNPADVLRTHGARTTTRYRTGAMLAALQVAISFAALAGAGLLVRSARQVRDGGGFDAAHVALFRTRPRLVGYGPAQARHYTAGVLARLSETPGVRSAAAVGIGAAWGVGDDATVWRPDAPPASAAAAPRASHNEITPRFFETLGGTLRRGRAFLAGDSVGAPPVAIVDATLAGRLWPDGTVLGRIVVVDGTPRRVVGIADNPYLHSATQEPRGEVWTPYWQNPGRVDARFAVRLDGDPASRLRELDTIARSVDPDVPVTEVLTMRSQAAAAYRSVRTIGAAVTYTGVLVMLLAGLGLHGVLSSVVAARRRSIAVRKALGATPGRIVWEVMAHVGSMVTGGIALGTVLAFAVSKSLAHLVFGISSGGPALLAIPGALVMMASLVASWRPLRRALRVPPREALSE